MPKRLLSSLSWKAGVAVAAFALAAGTGATTFSLVNDSSSGDTPTVTSTDTHGVSADHANDHAGDKDDEGDDAADDDTTKTVTADADANEHPDNFGAVVSADAKDGGVDGQTISDMAHAKNDLRKANSNTSADDHGKADDDHGVDGQEKADDANDDHGKSETDSDASDD
ncbi:MAG: hypothetical protein V7636_193 [Actinomycetota bacterium]|jgi:hypothetical protein